MQQRQPTKYEYVKEITDIEYLRDMLYTEIADKEIKKAMVSRFLELKKLNPKRKKNDKKSKRSSAANTDSRTTDTKKERGRERKNK